jgi:DNA-binding transcriptional ArsR family regulator
MPTSPTSKELPVIKAQFFAALAHPIRIRLLEVLVRQEARVQDLQRLLKLDQPIVSQQLARLRASGIVVARKDGPTTTYAVANPMIGELLRVSRQILTGQLVTVQGLLRQLGNERRRSEEP